ncbi:Clavaminate synthase-like protein [Lojkania enalia]|uniref:Clavaminate synthase-like protein n=1 Tax=Lojkania enalia TaxID=147567 RepID=A0A9P4TQ96_9PLEO|nr:Clavaminate synthase-like protein [Didymosphaeria enalia]
MTPPQRKLAPQNSAPHARTRVSSKSSDTPSRHPKHKFLDVIARFFALPLAEKEKLSQSKSPCYRGYERIGGQKLDELDADATPDQKEGFSVRPERPLGRLLAGPNQWPEEGVAPGFREAYMEYFDAVHALSKTIFQLTALSLNLPRTFFNAFATDPNGICLCHAHYYPPSPPNAAASAPTPTSAP